MDNTTSSAGRISSRGPRLLLVFAMITALLTSLTPSNVAYAAPANDNLADAVSITAPTFNSGTVDTSSATRETGEIGSCGNFPTNTSINTRSVWFKFSPASTGWLTLDTLTGTNYDTVIEIWAGNATTPDFTSLIPIACNDDATGSTNFSELQLAVAPVTNTAYYVAVRSFGSTATGGNMVLRGTFTTQQQVYVNDATGSDTNTGTFALPFKTIQKGVNTANSGAEINIAAGTYAENVSIGKDLILTGTGNPTATSFTLTRGANVTGSSGVSAPTVNINQTGGAGALISDAFLLVSSGGTVNVGAGTYAENLTINKNMTLQSTAGGIIQPASGTAITVGATPTSVTISGLNIVATTGVTNNSANAVTATNNYWGSGTGPTNGPPGGSGSAISANVDFSPWCFVANPTCTPITTVPELQFTAQPQNGATGVSIAPPNVVVTVVDATTKTTLTSFVGQVTLAIDTGPAGTPTATINGSATVAATAVNGVATFNNLVFNRVFSGYVLSATTPAAATITSDPFDIIKGTPVITVTGGTKAFTDPPFTVTTTASLTGLTITYTSLTPGVCSVSTDQVTIISIGTCTIQADSAATADVNAASDTGDFVIGPGNQTIVFDPSSVSSPDTVVGSTFTLTATGSLNNVPAATMSSTTPAVCTINPALSPTQVTVLTAGTCTISATGVAGGNYGNATGQFTFTAIKADQTISFISPTPANNTPFDASDPDFTVATSASPTGQNITFTAGPSNICSIATAPSSTSITVDIIGVGVCTVTAVAPGNTSYNASAMITRTFLINLVPADFTISVPSKVYDGQPLSVPIITWNMPASQPVSGTVTITYNGSSTPPSNAGTYTVLATLTDTVYGGTATTTAVISPKPASFTVSIPSKTYDGLPATAPVVVITGGAPQPDPSADISFSYIGILGTSYGPSSTLPTNAGTYQVIATVNNPNFTGTVNSPFTINKATQTILGFGALPNKVYGDAPFTLSARSSSNLTVVFTASGQCTVSGAIVTITGAGSCTITANQPGSTNYSAATPVSQSFIIAKIDQMITFDPLPTRAMQNPPIELTATASSGLAVVYSVSGPCNLDNGVLPQTVTPTAPGVCVVTAGQRGDANHNPATSVTRSFTIVEAFFVFQPYISRYGAPDLVTTFTMTPSGPSFAKSTLVNFKVEVTNTGSDDAGPFWVDLYINPINPPTFAVPWDRECQMFPCYGISWYVAGGLEKGKSVTLTSTPDSYYLDNTSWAGVLQNSTRDIYVYADSWNCDAISGGCIPEGAVLELNEANNRSEIRGLTITGANQSLAAPAMFKRMPARPAHP